MAKKNHGLGRGLDALLPDGGGLEAGLQQIPVGDIDPNPDQPRRLFTEEALADLARSIREQGVLQPLLVVPAEGGRYTIVAGERRWRAARLAELDSVPCVVRDMDVISQMEAALIENLQREDLNPIEEASGIKALMRQCGYTQEAAANRLGKSRPAIANALRLLNLPEDVQELVRRGTLSAGHARVIAGVSGAGKQRALAQETIRNGWSVRQLEQTAAGKKKTDGTVRTRELPVELADFETRLRETLGVRATLTGSMKRGRIILQYYSEDELERLNEVLLSMDQGNL